MEIGIICPFDPDILHVFGTENEESNKLVTLFNKPARTIVNIQGMARLHADVYTEGLPDRIVHGHDGYRYPFNMPQMLAHYVTEIFDSDSRAMELSRKAIFSQSVINDPVRNITALIEIYTKVSGTVLESDK